MINQAREVFCQRRFPASLIYVLIVSPPPSVPSTLMPLPSRSTSAGLPVVLDIALLPCSPLPLAAKETESDCLCPDGCAPRGNVPYIAATLAAATILQTGSASTDILLDRLHPAFRVRVQIRASCWQSKRIHTSRLDQFSKDGQNFASRSRSR